MRVNSGVVLAQEQHRTTALFPQSWVGKLPDPGTLGAKWSLFRQLTRTEREDHSLLTCLLPQFLASFIPFPTGIPEKNRLMAVESPELTKAIIIYWCLPSEGRPHAEGQSWTAPVKACNLHGCEKLANHKAQVVVYGRIMESLDGREKFQGKVKSAVGLDGEEWWGKDWKDKKMWLLLILFLEIEQQQQEKPSTCLWVSAPWSTLARCSRNKIPRMGPAIKMLPRHSGNKITHMEHHQILCKTRLYAQ